MKIDPVAANLAGVTDPDVALTTRAMFTGAELATYREGGHQIPGRLRTPAAQRRDLGDLSAIFVGGGHGKVPLDSIAELLPSWQPSVIGRRGMLPTVTIGSEVAEGALANDVANRLRPRLEAIVAELPTKLTARAARLKPR